MRCNRCVSEEDLKWPNPYIKGSKPIRTLDGKPHVCMENAVKESGELVIKERCNVCHKEIEGRYNHLHKV